MRTTIQRAMTFIVAATCLASAGVAQDAAQNATNPNGWPTMPNPYLNSYVGETVKYKSTSRVGGTILRSTETQTVTHHDGKMMKLKTTRVLSPQTTTETEVTIDLTKDIVIPYLMGYNPKTPIKFRIVATGSTVLPIGGKNFPVQWTTYELSGGGTPATRKIWFAKNGPLSGMLKDELFTSIHAVTEMVEFSLKVKKD